MRRDNAGNVHAFAQVFVHRVVYDFDWPEDVRRIVDARKTANVVFLQRLFKAQLNPAQISDAVEPHPHNAEAFRKKRHRDLADETFHGFGGAPACHVVCMKAPSIDGRRLGNLTNGFMTSGTMEASDNEVTDVVAYSTEALIPRPMGANQFDGSKLDM